MQTSGASPNQAIVILGAGFGGITAAKRLEKLVSKAGSVNAKIVLIDRHNYFLMTPLLFGAGSGVLEPRHVVSPIRKQFHRVRFVQANVQSVDLNRRVVRARIDRDGTILQVPFDQLVLALGEITNTRILPGADRVMTFKSLGDAIRLRNHVIELFERADTEADPDRKRQILTFVIIGGGLVGLELAGEMTDFLRVLSRSYPHIDHYQLRVELIQGNERIMPEMEASLAKYAAAVLERRGVRTHTSTRVQQIDTDQARRLFTVRLSGGGSIEARTVIAANGVRVSPLVDLIEVEKDGCGRVLTDATMRSVSQPNVWALGDCAHVPDRDGKPYPQLAQHALRQARTLAFNIAASLEGNVPRPFVYKSKGTLAALGSLTGVGHIGRIRVPGFLAWWIWRSYYLIQMPKWNRRARIAFDWTISLLFKNDIVELDVRAQA